MNEPESSDQDFNEVHDDFDFGEETPEVRSFSHQAPMSKKLLLVIFAIIMTAILGFGYRFYKPSDTTQKMPSIIAETQPTITHQTTVKTDPIELSITPHHTPTHDLEPAFAATDTAPAPPVPSKPLVTPPLITATEQPIPTLTQQPVIAPTQQELYPENSLSTEMMKQLTQSLDKLNQQIDYIFGKINYLDSYTHEVSQNLDKLNQSITVMDQRLSSLTNTTHALSEDVGGVKNEVSHVKETLKDEGFDQEPIRHTHQPSTHSSLEQSRDSKTQGAITPENPEYLVHAVIPGRAWLKSSKGTIITVAEGDTIGNYGKVLLIDAAHGLVLTSSGITFR